MKVLSLTKRDILSAMGIILLGATALTIGGTTAAKAITTAAETRDIPIYSVDTTENKVSISFDAAWGNEQTTELLNILESYDVKATFFLVGQWVDKYPESVKEIADKGHDVENHSDTHAHMPQLSHDGIRSEIMKCNEKIKAITGKSPTLFRPPYGDYDNSVVGCVKDCGMYCLQWNIDSLDWKNLSAAEITERIIKRLSPGSIVLLHNGAENTPEALPYIIEGIRSQGYELVPISELLPKGEYTTDHEGRMHLCE